MNFSVSNNQEQSNAYHAKGSSELVGYEPLDFFKTEFWKQNSVSGYPREHCSEKYDKKLEFVVMGNYAIGSDGRIYCVFDESFNYSEDSNNIEIISETYFDEAFAEATKKNIVGYSETHKVVAIKINNLCYYRYYDTEDNPEDVSYDSTTLDLEAYITDHFSDEEYSEAFITDHFSDEE